MILTEKKLKSELKEKKTQNVSDGKRITVNRLFKKKKETEIRFLNRFNKHTKQQLFNPDFEMENYNFKFLSMNREDFIKYTSNKNIPLNDLENGFKKVFLHHNLFNLERYYPFSNKFLMYEFSYIVNNKKHNFFIKQYKTGEVYMVHYYPNVWKYYLMSVADFNNFNIYDYLFENHLNDFIVTDYDLMLDKVLNVDCDILYPRHQWGLNTKRKQYDYLKDSIDKYLMSILDSPKYYGFSETEHTVFNKDNRPNYKYALEKVKKYLTDNNITKTEIINDFLNLRNVMSRYSQIRTTSYKKISFDFPNQGVFSNNSDIDYHEFYRYDLECFFDRHSLNNTEVIELKKILKQKQLIL